MSVPQESPAVAVALAHVQAWSNHDFDSARRGLAPDVTVRATTTQPIMPDVNLTGIDDYMRGLIQFAEGVVPGTAQVVATRGDKRNALIMLTVETDLGSGKVTLPAARLYRLDENNKIKTEQVVFYAADL
jgi:hypothetical protein